MGVFKTILWASALLAMPNFANAASASRNCFETKQQAKNFVENLESADRAFHVSEKQTRELMQTPGLKYKMLKFIFGGGVEFHDVDPKSAAEVGHNSTLSHKNHHYHLTAMSIVENSAGQFCSLVGSEVHVYNYYWFLDANKNILNSKFLTEISR